MYTYDYKERCYLAINLNFELCRKHKKNSKKATESIALQEKDIFAEQKQSVQMSNSALAKITVSCSVYDVFFFFADNSVYTLWVKHSA